MRYRLYPVFALQRVACPAPGTRRFKGNVGMPGYGSSQSSWGEANSHQLYVAVHTACRSVASGDRTPHHACSACVAWQSLSVSGVETWIQHCQEHQYLCSSLAKSVASAHAAAHGMSWLHVQGACRCQLRHGCSKHKPFVTGHIQHKPSRARHRPRCAAPGCSVPTHMHECHMEGHSAWDNGSLRHT